MFEKIKPIINKFQISGQVHQIHPIEIGHINQTYQIIIKNKAAKTNYILQRVNMNVFKRPIEVMENIAKVGTYLQQNNYPKKILLPIQNIDNQYVVIDDNNDYWRLFPFIKNTKTINQVSNEEEAYAAAFTFGEYMRYLKGFDATELHYTIADFHNTNLRYKQFLNIAKNANKKRKKVAEKSIETLHQFRYLLEPIQRLKLPLRVVHNDTKINNILFDKNSSKAVCVIDLDTLMPGALLYDYGDMVRTFTPSIDENSSNFDQIFVRKNILKSLTTGYLDGLEDSITPLEQKVLLYGARLITFEQAIRFLMDYLNGNSYYKVGYAEQNLVRAKNQICLLQDLCKLS